MAWGLEVYNSSNKKVLDLTTPTAGIIVRSFQLSNSYSGTITVPESKGKNVFLMLEPSNSHGISQFPFVVTPRVTSHNRATGEISWSFPYYTTNNSARDDIIGQFRGRRVLVGVY